MIFIYYNIFASKILLQSLGCNIKQNCSIFRKKDKLSFKKNKTRLVDPCSVESDSGPCGRAGEWRNSERSLQLGVARNHLRSCAR